jgi:hypothetical protein
LESEERGTVESPAPGGFQRERLDRALARASDAPLREGNRLELLKNGPDTYEDWLAAISGAERWVHLDNYIFRDDEVGERFARALIRKAEEGVSVRVLYDWFGCLDVDRSFWRRMREAGVDVRGSKVGSTNLNVASLVANWEIDLVAEDIGFAAQMEELFEEDLSNAREVRLAGSAAHPRVRPERPIQSSDRDARRGGVGSGSGGSATILRVGSTALQKSGYPLETHEQALAAAASGALLGASLLSLRFPRFLAWPLAAVGALYGGLGVLRAARSTISERIRQG